MALESATGAALPGLDGLDARLPGQQSASMPMFLRAPGGLHLLTSRRVFRPPMRRFQSTSRRGSHVEAQRSSMEWWCCAAAALAEQRLPVVRTAPTLGSACANLCEAARPLHSYTHFNSNLWILESREAICAVWGPESHFGTQVFVHFGTQKMRHFGTQNTQKPWKG